MSGGMKVPAALVVRGPPRCSARGSTARSVLVPRRNSRLRGGPRPDDLIAVDSDQRRGQSDECRWCYPGSPRSAEPR